VYKCGPFLSGLKYYIKGLFEKDQKSDPHTWSIEWQVLEISHLNHRMFHHNRQNRRCHPGFRSISPGEQIKHAKISFRMENNSRNLKNGSEMSIQRQQKYTVHGVLMLRFLRNFRKLTAKTLLNSEISFNVTIFRV